MSAAANELNFTRQAGFYAPDVAWVRDNTLVLTANRAYAARFVPVVTKKITVVAFAVATAATNDDSCDVGIYDAAGNRLTSSGATAGKLNATGVKTIALPYTLKRGTAYYAAFAYGAVGGTAATVATVLISSGNFGIQLFGATVGTMEVYQKDTSYPLPSSISSPATASQVPLLALRES